MTIDEAVEVIIGYCDKHNTCFKTKDGDVSGMITSRCRFFNEDWEDCVLKQCPVDWLRGEE